MRSTRQVLQWAVLALLMLAPSMALGRDPLTDSTDVKIPTTRNEAENSIAISPLNSKVLVVSNNARVSGSNGGNSSWISLDAGKTWLTTDSLVLNPSRADPACAIGRSGGTNGRYFVNHLDSDDFDLGIHYKDTTGGTSWTHKEIDAGKSSGNAGTDKNHLAINNNTSGSYQNHLISAFSEALNVSGVYAYRSENNGVSWTTTRSTIFAGGDSRDHRGVNLQWSPASPGKVYACWAMRDTQLPNPPLNTGFRYSSNGGDIWNAPSAGHAIQAVSGFTSLPGKTGDGWTLQAPVLAVNMDNGHLYIVFTTKVTGQSDADVFVIKSTDEGQTWGSRVRVHANVADKDQWHPWISWDDCTGAVVVTFLDSRDYTNNDGANTYMSVSLDGAATWNDFKVSDSGWNGDSFSGHYMGLAAKDGVAFPVWSDDREFGSGNHRPYISPVYLWGVTQSSVSHSVSNDPGLELSVTATWSTSLAALGTDYIVVKSPTGLTYTGTATPSGTGLTHTATKVCPCETGDWTYTVKSTRTGFTPRGSDPKTLPRVYYCVD